MRCLHENVYIENSNLNIQSDFKLSKLQALIIMCNENNVNTCKFTFHIHTLQLNGYRGYRHKKFSSEMSDPDLNICSCLQNCDLFFSDKNTFKFILVNFQPWGDQ